MQDLIDNLTPEAVQSLSLAVETGKWADGTPLTPEQLESAMQAVLLYRARQQAPSDEPFVVNNRGELQSGQQARARHPAGPRARSGDTILTTVLDQD